ncbi:MAG TPA: hypothetical protein PKE41_11020 [Candidatus Macondimonas sp.]|nr:hypothetical protein [Candidatus Macondimonas sp.]
MEPAQAVSTNDSFASAAVPANRVATPREQESTGVDDSCWFIDIIADRRLTLLAAIGGNTDRFT